MTEQQYRVIADRDKSDRIGPGMIEPLDRVTYVTDEDKVLEHLVRIERPVPTEHCLSTAHHSAHEWGHHAGQPGTGYWCRGFDAFDEFPSVPTREQIAEAIASAVDGMTEKAWQNASVDYRNEMLDGADAVLALLQKGGDRG